MRPISNVDDTRGGERADEVHSCPFSSVPLRQTELDSCLTADCSRRSYDEHVHAFEPLTATSISTTVGATISIPSARAGDKAFGEAGWLIEDLDPSGEFPSQRGNMLLIRIARKRRTLRLCGPFLQQHTPALPVLATWYICSKIGLLAATNSTNNTPDRVGDTHIVAQ